MIRLRLLAALLMCATSCMAWAGEAPLYQPAPAWAIPALLPSPSAQADNPSPIILLDLQQRIEGDQLSIYVDTASRIASPELLGQMANLSIPWAPDKGDLLIHGLSIVRGNETIDLLAKGQRFTVLRREQALEQRELTGILTATLAVEGLQVGDVLRLRVTTTARDKALGGKGENGPPHDDRPQGCRTGHASGSTAALGRLQRPSRAFQGAAARRHVESTRAFVTDSYPLTDRRA